MGVSRMTSQINISRRQRSSFLLLDALAIHDGRCCRNPFRLLVRQVLPSPAPRQNKTGRDKTGRALVGVIVLAFVICLWSPVALAEPPSEASVKHALATNQSVTLDDVVSAAESDDYAEKVEQQDVAQKNEQPSTTALMLPARGDVARSELRESRRFRTSEPAAVPWYRSGVGALFIVFVVIGASYYVIRKWMPTMRAPDGDIIKVLSRTALSPKHHAVLIKVGKRMLLVGMTTDRMTTLTELTDDDELGDALVSSGAAKRKQREQFESLLVEEQDRFSEEEADLEETHSSPSGRREPLSKLLHRLRQLQSSS